MLMNPNCEMNMEDMIALGKKLGQSVLPTSLGANAGEDVFSGWYLRMKEKGYSDESILASAATPGFLWRALINFRNDLYRSETTVQNGERVFREEGMNEDFLEATENLDPEILILENENLEESKQRVQHLFRVAKLSATQQQVVLMDLEGYSTDEIAAELATTKSTVYARRSEALDAIQQVLEVNKTILRIE